MYQNLKSLKEKEIKLGGGLSKMVKEFGTLCIARPERKGRVMLIIKIGGEVLTYNRRKGKWVCSDRVLEQVCNNMLPEGRMLARSYIYRRGWARGLRAEAHAREMGRS